MSTFCSNVLPQNFISNIVCNSNLRLYFEFTGVVYFPTYPKFAQCSRGLAFEGASKENVLNLKCISGQNYLECLSC